MVRDNGSSGDGLWYKNVYNYDIFLILPIVNSMGTKSILFSPVVFLLSACTSRYSNVDLLFTCSRSDFIRVHRSNSAPSNEIPNRLPGITRFR